MYAKWRKPISRKCSAAIRVTIRGSVSSIAPFDGPMRTAQIDGWHAQLGDGLGNFFVLDAGDDAVAFPRAKKLGHVFGQTPLDMQHAPATVRTHVRRHAQQASAAIRPRAFDQQHDSLAISRHAIQVAEQTA